MTEPWCGICFVPGCKERAGVSNLTFHRLPSSANLHRQLLLLLFKDLDPLELPVIKNHNVMCSAHFSSLMSNTDLVHVMVNCMVTKKPSQEAVSVAPKCAAFGCHINLYSDIALFEFPSNEKRFTLWRRVAGWPKMTDCNYLCARHFKRSSFIDVDRRKLAKGAWPVYPTRPFNTKYQNYCPLKKPASPPQSTLIMDKPHDEGDATSKPKIASRKKWHCAAKGCDVSYLSHPDMRKINFPSDPDRLNLWREVVGYIPNVKYSMSLCTRHFALSQFYDEETRRNAVKLANPVYPTGPLNFNTNDYCPPELDVTVQMEDEESVTIEDTANDSVITVVEGSRTSEIILVEDNKRCSAAGCPVNSMTHPTVKLHYFPETNMRKMLVWLKIAGCAAEEPRLLCERHFDVNSRDLIPKYPFGELDPQTHTYMPVFNPVDPNCCVPGCTSSSGDNVAFHRFPLNKNTFDAWINEIDCKKLTLYDQGDVFRGFRVCSRHFTESDYIITEDSSGSEMALKATSVPTCLSRTADEVDGSVSEEVASDIEVEFHDADDAATESLPEEDRPIKSELGVKRRPEIVTVTPDSKRIKVDPDVECDPLSPDDTMESERPEGSWDGGSDDEWIEPVVNSQVNVAMRLCKMSSRKIKELKIVTGKRLVAVNVLARILTCGLSELVNIVGLQFLKDCFSHILESSRNEEDNDKVFKFCAVLMTFSQRLYRAIGQVRPLPPQHQVLNGLICSNGVPGVSRKGMQRLKEKNELVGSGFLVSLSVVEVPLRKEVSWTGKETLGYVDLGHGRIDDVTLEATSALSFHANSPTHDFSTPLGYCLVDSLSPHVRANLISLYLSQIHFAGVRCNSVVTEDSRVAYQTYEELGVVCDGLPVAGFFPHPVKKNENVFCFVDVDDSFRAVRNLLADVIIFVSDSGDIWWPDVELIQRLPQWDLTEFPQNLSRLHYLRSLQLKLKKDLNIFKKNSSSVLNVIKKHQQSTSGTGTSEFLAKMDAIDNLFSGCNVFCKEAPAVQRKNVMISLGRIQNAIIYMSSLTDSNGRSLLKGPRSLSGLALNLVSLSGYLKRLLIRERKIPKDKMTMMIKTQSLTLRDVRSVMPGEIGTAKEFRAAFKSILRGGKDFKPSKSDESTGPLHIGLNLSESHKYELLTSRCEHTEEQLMKNVVCRWLEETSCPDCAFVVSTASDALTADVRKLLRTAERRLRTCQSVPLDEGFSRFVCEVLLDTTDFSGFLSAGHLFDSVEFGRTSHFTLTVNGLLRTFLRYRIGFMSTTTKVTIRPDTRQMSFHRSVFSL